MKKQFTIQESNHAPARQVDKFKHEIKQYIARERRKDLPENMDYWDFECKIGDSQDSLVEIHLSEINKAIDRLIVNGCNGFFIEVIAQAKARKKHTS